MPVSFGSDAISAFESLARRSSSARILASESTAGGMTTVVLRHKSVFQRTDYDVNVATMNCFREALEGKYGVFGGNAFDAVLGDRFMARQGLRGEDVLKTIARVEKMMGVRVRGEVERQVACSPLTALRFPDGRLRAKMGLSVEKQVLDECKRSQKAISEGELSRIVMRCLAEEMGKDEWRSALPSILPGASAVEPEASSKAVKKTDAVGLRNLLTQAPTSRNGGLFLENGQDGVAYRVRTGQLMTGMRINNGNANPVVLRSLKSKGVEPGFVYSNDWRVCDTQAMMRSAGLNEKSLAAYAEALILKYRGNEEHPIGKAIKWACGQKSGGKYIVPRREQGQEDGKWMAAVKALAFAALRDEIVNPRDQKVAARFPGVGTRFRTRYLVKLDYGAADRSGPELGRIDSGGLFTRSERVLNSPDKKAALFRNGKYCGVNSKFFTNKFFTTTAFDVNVGAVSEALANDLMRVTGINAQALSLSLGKYADGKPKFLLQAEVAEGYHDLEDGDEANRNIIQDGYLAKGVGIKDLAKWKIAFLLFGDRDAVGSHAQNKGFIRNKDGSRTFFAIDPGKTLAGNPRVLHDDFSFDRSITDKASKWFENFTVFDDFKRSEKFAGVLVLAKEDLRTRYAALFRSYEDKMSDLRGNGMIDAKLCNAILMRLDKMRTELFAQYDHVMQVFRPQLNLYNDVRRQTGSEELAKQAIDALDLMEKLSSPTSTVSSDKANAKQLDYRRILPGKRIPWTAKVAADRALEFSSTAKLTDAKIRDLMTGLSKTGGGASLNLTVDGQGRPVVRVPAAHLEAFLGAIDERRAFAG